MSQILIRKYSAFIVWPLIIRDEGEQIVIRYNTRWNIIHIDDAKRLEFSSVIVLLGRMSRNQQYTVYTRILDDLYIPEHHRRVWI